MKMKMKMKDGKETAKMGNIAICYMLHIWMYKVGVLNSSNIRCVRLLRRGCERKKKEEEIKQIKCHNVNTENEQSGKVETHVSYHFGELKQC